MPARRIAVAGYMGSGKSTCARILAGRGLCIIDADHEAKKVMLNDRPLQARLKAVFGADTAPDGVIDFRILGERAFASRENLLRLNSIVHPPVFAALSLLMQERRAEGFVLDAALAPLLPTAGMFDLLLWIDAPREVRTDRVAAKTGMDRAAVARRMDLQELIMPAPQDPPWMRLDNAGRIETLATTLNSVVTTGDPV